MILDFLLPIRVGSQEAIVSCRDVPAAVYWYGYPGVPPDADGFMAARREWVNGLLSRAIVRPHLVTVDTLERLGPARDELERRYLAAVGQRPAVPGEPLILGFDPDPIAPAPPASWLPALSSPPPAEALGAILALAQMFHVPPAAIWLAPISEYLVNQAIVLGAKSQQPGGHGLSRLEGEVGMEGG